VFVCEVDWEGWERMLFVADIEDPFLWEARTLPDIESSIGLPIHYWECRIERKRIEIYKANLASRLFKQLAEAQNPGLLWKIHVGSLP
jgi:hypothetical protein